MVYLVFPPFFELDHPYLSLPMLKGALKLANIPVKIFDLNMDFFKRTFSKESLNRMIDDLNFKVSDAESRRLIFYEEAGEFIRNHIDLLKLRVILKNFEAIKKVFNEKELFFDDAYYNTAMNLILNFFRVFSNFNFPIKVSVGAFFHPQVPLISRKWQDFIRDEQNNFLKRYVYTLLEEGVFSEEPLIFGVSIVDTDQVLPALTIIHTLKSYFKKTFFVIGGPFFTKFEPLLLRDNLLFNTIDGVILGEGEVPLIKLYQSLKHGDSLYEVPNLIFFDKKKGQIVETKPKTHKILNIIPDFDDYDFKDYLSPLPVIPVLGSRGCYWNRCAFCSHSYVYRDKFEQRRAKAVFEEMVHHYKRYGVKHFFFTDESLSPHFIRGLSTLIEASEYKFFYTGEIRFEKAFNEELLAKAYANGLSLAIFGLESASQSLLDKIDKGIEVKTAQKILNLCQKIGIVPHLWLITGFPDETFDEALENIRFLERNRRLQDNPDYSVSLNEFVLARNSLMWKYPFNYGIRHVDYTKEEYRTYDPFISDRALSEEQKREIFILYEEWEENLPPSIRQTGRIYNFLRNSNKKEISESRYKRIHSPFNFEDAFAVSRYNIVQIAKSLKGHLNVIDFRQTGTLKPRIFFDPLEDKVFFK